MDKSQYDVNYLISNLKNSLANHLYGKYRTYADTIRDNKKQIELLEISIHRLKKENEDLGKICDNVYKSLDQELMVSVPLGYGVMFFSNRYYEKILNKIDNTIDYFIFKVTERHLNFCIKENGNKKEIVPVINLIGNVVSIGSSYLENETKNGDMFKKQKRSELGRIGVNELLEDMVNNESINKRVNEIYSKLLLVIDNALRLPAFSNDYVLSMDELEQEFLSYTDNEIILPNSLINYINLDNDKVIKLNNFDLNFNPEALDSAIRNGINFEFNNDENGLVVNKTKNGEIVIYYSKNNDYIKECLLENKIAIDLNNHTGNVKEIIFKIKQSLNYIKDINVNGNIIKGFKSFIIEDFDIVIE